MTEEDIAIRLGQAIQSWAQAIHDVEIAEAQLELANEMVERIATLRLELDQATHRLRAIAEDARHQWTDDTLVGKDAGPAATTTLLPTDSEPEIEDSALARGLFTDIEAEHTDRLEGDDLITFVSRWANKEANRSFFSLGSGDAAEQSAAERSLAVALVEEAREHALFTGEGNRRQPRLPADLPSAETLQGDLSRALGGLVTLSRSICWSWDEGRFQLGDGDQQTQAGTARPAVTSVIAHPDGLADRLGKIAGANAQLVPVPDDPERVVALSVEWAVPVHALHDITNWRAAYERVRRNRQADPYSHPPLHTDRRFADELDPLVPAYFEVEDVAQLIGQALIIKDLLENESTGLAKAYDYSRTRPMVPHIRLDADGRWLGRQLTTTDGRLRALGDDILLGVTWASVLKAVGENHALRTSIESTAVWLKRRLGAERVLEGVDLFLESELEPLIDASASRPKDVEVLNLVLDGLSSWQVDLRLLSLAG